MPKELNQLEEFALSLVRVCVGEGEEILLNFRLHGVEMDFYLPKRNICIAVDGRLWHDDEKGSGRPMTRLGVRCLTSGEIDRGVFWINKADKNRARDKEVNKILKSNGIYLVRLREDKLNGSDPLAYVSAKLAKSLMDSVLAGRKPIEKNR